MNIDCGALYLSKRFMWIIEEKQWLFPWKGLKRKDLVKKTSLQMCSKICKPRFDYMVAVMELQKKQERVSLNI